LIRATESDADVDRWLAIRNEIFPTIAFSRAVLDVQDRHGPEGRVKLLADDVGFAIVTPAHSDDPHAWLTVGVLEAARGQGIGTALWQAGAEHLLALGVTTTRSLSIEGVAAGARFLEQRGFVVAGRETALERDLRDLPPAPPLPVGFQLVHVARDSELFRDVYELELETVRDIPGEEGVRLPAFDAWQEELDAEGEAVALGLLDAGDLVGMAILSFPHEEPGVVWHWMTAVRASYRRRGLGVAIKHAALQAAAERGATISRTFNESRNVGMRRINEKFGYLPRPDLLKWEGPCSS
jgi:GNAT superfamily N-acetyltransferase